jgi:nitrate reductase NapE component
MQSRKLNEIRQALIKGETWADLITASVQANKFTLFIVIVVGVFAVIGVASVARWLFF